MKDQAAHTISEIDEHNPGLSTFYTDGANELNHVRLLLGKDMLHPRPHFLGLSLLAAPSVSDLGLPLGFLRWI